MNHMSSRTRPQGPVPLTLVRLKSATRAYVAVLRGSLPELVELETAVSGTGVTDDVLGALTLSIRATLDDSELVGGVSTMMYLLGLLLGEVEEGDMGQGNDTDTGRKD